MRGHIPPQPGFGGQVSSPMGQRLGPGGGNFPPTKGKTSAMGSGGSGGSQAGPFGRTRARPSLSSHLPPVGGKNEGLRRVSTEKKRGDGDMKKRSYQHVDFAKGYKHLGVIGSMPGQRTTADKPRRSSMSGGTKGRHREVPKNAQPSRTPAPKF